MNMHTSDVMSPPAPCRLAGYETFDRDDARHHSQTMFRKSIDVVSELSATVCLPVPVTQELLDLARSQQLLEATGTLNANNGDEMGYQLTEQGKARALDALAQSEYFGAMPVPLDVYRTQVDGSRSGTSWSPRVS